MGTTVNIVSELLQFFDVYFTKDLVIKEVEVIKKNRKTNKLELIKSNKTFKKINNKLVPLSNEYYKELNNKEYNIYDYLDIESRTPFVTFDKVKQVEQHLNSGYKKLYNKERVVVKNDKPSLYDSYVNSLSNLIIKLVVKDKETILKKEETKHELTDQEERELLIKNAKSLVRTTKNYNVIDTKAKTLKHTKYN